MTDINDLVDLDKGSLKGHMFTDEDIYQQELDKVWRRAWCFLAHDSMIPKKGDFLQNFIGEDPVLIVRQKDGSVKAFLNQCRHRGMRICRVDQGAAKAFTCSFHGWSYGLDGSLIQVPREGDAYPDDFDKANYPARPIPRLTNYKGFWFGTWDEEAPEFEEYLGSAKYYLDGYIDRWDGGMEPIAFHKWTLPNNWKFMAEQPTSDMQHSEITHVSAGQVLNKGSDAADRTLRGDNPTGRQFFSDYGHGGAWYGEKGSEVPNTGQAMQKWEAQPEIAEQIAKRLGDNREIRGHLNIWPTFMVLGNYTIRVTHPRGPGHQEIWAWTFVPKDADDATKDSIRRDVMRTFTPGGMFEGDDALNWEEMQEVLHGRIARDSGFTYQMTGAPIQWDEGPYPGGSTKHVFSDNAAINMYSNYVDMMNAENWDELKQLREKHRMGKSN
ncbi:aromatic ring-hydroxylating oxygenase subunit alpha [Granulicoccus phenolivorans]|uniref:aromatic ring-hydroxylating oxygenase subunit alpha n=1 Tax=Granulicoccus phenolivorans TaxID=266854 RepID=UPI0004156ADF|nr:SRPBCC family protein [Granulicoccus phenolivorans]